MSVFFDETIPVLDEIFRNFLRNFLRTSSIFDEADFETFSGLHQFLMRMDECVFEEISTLLLP